MIPVIPKSEPDNFDEIVRKPGLDWLNDKGIPLDGPAPSNLRWNALWTQSINFAHEVYQGQCAYLACYLELATGEVTIDHFVSKNSKPSLAFEWGNYRLSSLGANRLKGEQKVLDPFLVEIDWFHVELVSGKIFANSAMSRQLIDAVNDTINKLGLDNERCRKMRAIHFSDYISNEYGDSHLRKINPLVYKEVARQNLLK